MCRFFLRKLNKHSWGKSWRILRTFPPVLTGEGDHGTQKFCPDLSFFLSKNETFTLQEERLQKYRLKALVEIPLMMGQESRKTRVLNLATGKALGRCTAPLGASMLVKATPSGPEAQCLP